MHYAVIDLGYGDAGKGILTARLCAEHDISWVIRTSGGCQCAHNVITDDGKHHTFAQFGSGTFSGAKTFLSKYMLVEPFSLINEAEHLEKLGVDNAMRRVIIDPDALITTPYHWELNQWEEDQRARGRHGSTGRGIGMTTLFSLEYPNDAPRMGDIYLGSLFKAKLARLRVWCLEKGVPEARLPSVDMLYDRYLSIENQLIIMRMSWSRILDQEQVVFEGAQGVLLDQDHGFHPHTTWTRTTDYNVRRFLEDAGSKDVPLTTIGVIRTYMTRHGAGPFTTEYWPSVNIEKHNGAAHFQGHWRVGYPDIVVLRYAIECCERIDGLYVTHTDAPDSYMSSLCIKYQTSAGLPVEIEHIPTEDRYGRELQSQRLSAASPILVANLPSDTAGMLSAALNVPLFGTGWGPKISEGAFDHEAMAEVDDVVGYSA